MRPSSLESQKVNATGWKARWWAVVDSDKLPIEMYMRAVPWMGPIWLLRIIQSGQLLAAPSHPPLRRESIPSFNFIHGAALVPRCLSSMNTNWTPDCFKWRSEQDTSFHLVKSCHFRQRFFWVSFLPNSMQTPLHRTACVLLALGNRKAIHTEQKSSLAFGPLCGHCQWENPPAGGVMEWRRKLARRQFRGHLLEGGGIAGVLLPLQGCFDHFKCHFHDFHSHEVFKA